MEKFYKCYGRGIIIYITEDNNCKVKFLKGSKKHDVYYYLPENFQSPFTQKYVEVRFKNTRKDIYLNNTGLNLKINDIIVVETLIGEYDIGIVSSLGEFIYNQIITKKIDPQNIKLKVLRKATQSDIRKWYEAIQLEEYTMLKARQIAKSLDLNMKITDVEYQGDKLKATFYFIAEDRVDFRQLIKILASEFHIKVEMRQIGVRQECGRIGGIGTCGKPLCCCSWLKKYDSVLTSCIEIQELTANPQKLTGQCGKLKCCLNYEVDLYYEFKKSLPPNYQTLYFSELTLYYQKFDLFNKLLYYSPEKESLINLIPFTLEKVKEIVELNSKNILPEYSEYTSIKLKKSKHTK